MSCRGGNSYPALRRPVDRDHLRPCFSHRPTGARKGSSWILIVRSRASSAQAFLPAILRGTGLSQTHFLDI